MARFSVSEFVQQRASRDRGEGTFELESEHMLYRPISMAPSVVGIFAGGLFNMRFRGSGLLAITTYYDPLALQVRP